MRNIKNPDIVFKKNYVDKSGWISGVWFMLFMDIKL